MTLDQTFVDSYGSRERAGDHPLFRSFNGLGFLVYRRTYSRPLYNSAGEYVRHEEWFETVQRVVDGANNIGANLTEAESERLFDLLWNAKALVGGRMLWQLGTDNANRLGSASLVNCYYTDLSEPDDFRFLFEMLMLGGGVGFNVTPESAAKLPEVSPLGNAELAPGFDVDFIVPDNREGWGQLLVRVLDAFFEGHTFTYSTAAIRREGSPIKTFGGTASGPAILEEGVSDIVGILGGARGRKLSTVEVLDIANIIGRIVVSGNVRRSAQIALGDANDSDYLAAKRWDMGVVPAYRAQSNNTVFVKDIDDLPDFFWDGYTMDEKGHAKGEAYGLFNLSAAQRFGRTGEEKLDESIAGVNPCGEIPLANRESCNLTELVLPKFDSIDELFDATLLLYKVQKAVSALDHVEASTDAITSRNMRLGMGVTGVAMSTDEQLGWLDQTYKLLEAFDVIWSKAHGWPNSVRLTTVKPSGTLSLLAGVTPGVHPGYSRFHIRRVRIASGDPVLQWAVDQGIPWEHAYDQDGNIDTRTTIVEFPCEFPEGTATADETSALDQLWMARRMQRLWADNAVSVTVTYKPEELDDIRDSLRLEWSTMKSVSFLPYSGHGFVQAPLEPIDEAEYRERLAVIDIQHDQLFGESTLDDAECITGACPIR